MTESLTLCASGSFYFGPFNKTLDWVEVQDGSDTLYCNVLLGGIHDQPADRCFVLQALWNDEDSDCAMFPTSYPQPVADFDIYST